jgi:Xaa-Pro aminopeptidase
MAYVPLRYYLYEGNVVRVARRATGTKPSSHVWNPDSASWDIGYSPGPQKLSTWGEELSEADVAERLSTNALGDESNQRMERVRALVEEHDADAALLSSLPDVRWACGFTGSNGLLLVHADGEADFLTDGRYRNQAAREVTDAEVHVTRRNLIEYVEEQYLLRKGERVLFQSDDVTVAGLGEWKDQLERVEWTATEGLVRELVAAKDEFEISKLRAAQRLTESVFRSITSLVWRGLTERELATEIVHQHRREGAERMAFEPVVASGPNGALPHARPTDRSFQQGDLVVIDMGGVVDGYASDMTRTVAVGEPGEEAREVYDVVRRAQEAALQAARPGMQSDALDAVAREVIEDAGYGSDFPHSLGHGLGLRTHEWPSVSYRRDYALPERAALTIEPGVYRSRRFGVRIEDTVVLRKSGAENLTRAPKDLIVC